MTQSPQKPSTQNTDQYRLKVERAIQQLQEFSLHQLQPLTVLHWIGYGLLLLFLFDLVELLYSPQFMNPAWEFETFGQLVERVPIPLIGFALVIVGGQSRRAKLEQPLLKLLSWGTIIFALVFYLSIPLGIFNTIRLNQQLNTQVITQMEQQMTEVQGQVTVVKEEIEKVNSIVDLQVLLSQIESQTQMPEIPSDAPLATAKQQITAFLDNQVAGLENQAMTELNNQSWQLFMRSVKWNLGALISGTLFFLLWKETKWAR